MASRKLMKQYILQTAFSLVMAQTYTILLLTVWHSYATKYSKENMRHND